MIKPKIPRQDMQAGKLLLKPYCHGVENELFRLIQQNLTDLTHSFPQMLGATRTLAETKEYIQGKIRLWNKNEALAFLVYSDGKLAGHFNLRDIDWKVPKAELAYWIDASLRRKGLMTAVIQTMLQFAFEKLQMERVAAKIVTSNIASERVLQKAGLKYEGTFIHDYRTFDNRIVDTHIYALTKDDYFRQKLKP